MVFDPCIDKYQPRGYYGCGTKKDGDWICIRGSKGGVQSGIEKTIDGPAEFGIEDF